MPVNKPNDHATRAPHRARWLGAVGVVGRTLGSGTAVYACNWAAINRAALARRTDSGV